MKKMKQLLARAHRLADRYCVTQGRKFRLDDVDPADTAWVKGEQKPFAK